MNRLIASLLIVAVAGIFAQIQPSSEQNIALPHAEVQMTLDALVNDNFGVLLGVGNEGTLLGSFEVGSDFSLNQLAYIDNECSEPQLINDGDNVNTFLLFCNGNDSVSFQTINIDPSTGNMSSNGNNVSTYYPNGVAMISASAFVTKQGNVYMADSSDGVISIIEFHVSDGDFNTRFENILDDYSGDYTIQDLHSLPYDSGVSVILNSQSNGTQLFLACYFNGTTFTNAIPEEQIIQYVGRHRGSNFGYTIAIYEDNSPYTVVTAWDLTDRSVSNSVEIKGQLLKRNDGHFSTNEAVFVYSESGESGYIYQLPYSEIGFLPNSVNSVEVDDVAAGNLADGQDGSHIYCYTATGSSVQFSRWSF